MKQEPLYVTVLLREGYGDAGTCRTGREFILKKERDNIYDDEAIAVYSLQGIKSGYVANSVGTVVRGTHSAGYVYERIPEEISCVVRFASPDSVIAAIEDDEER
ncbi:MAG: hypothetical protein IKF51_03510 [Solobacterium sp.]|nr:hypothetical protein [Solobacterium sp.]